LKNAPWIQSFRLALAGSFWPFGTNQSALSTVYITQIEASCFWLLVHWMRLAAALARARAGSNSAASKAMIATTIMISTRVKPPRLVVSFLNITNDSFCYLLVRAGRRQDCSGLVTYNSFPATGEPMTGE
jgi:hypothetical protein